MNEDLYKIIYAIIPVVSAFISSWLTYYYTELTWRKREHLKELKTCLELISQDVSRFEYPFIIYEGKISQQAILSNFGKRKPFSDWCKGFSFGFDRFSTSSSALGCGILLHDLENHFPELVSMLKEFEKVMRDLCFKYDEYLYELIKEISAELPNTIDDNARAISTEVIIMSLAGYSEGYYPNDMRFLQERGLAELINEARKKVLEKHGELVKQFNSVRERSINYVKEIKSAIEKAKHSHKLEGKCELL